MLSKSTRLAAMLGIDNRLPGRVILPEADAMRWQTKPEQGLAERKDLYQTHADNRPTTFVPPSRYQNCEFTKLNLMLLAKEGGVMAHLCKTKEALISRLLAPGEMAPTPMAFDRFTMSDTRTTRATFPYTGDEDDVLVCAVQHLGGAKGCCWPLVASRLPVCLSLLS